MLFLFEGVSTFSGCLRKGCVIILWHYLGLPFNLYEKCTLEDITNTLCIEIGAKQGDLLQLYNTCISIILGEP